VIILPIQGEAQFDMGLQTETIFENIWKVCGKYQHLEVPKALNASVVSVLEHTSVVMPALSRDQNLYQEMRSRLFGEGKESALLQSVSFFPEDYEVLHFNLIDQNLKKIKQVEDPIAEKVGYLFGQTKRQIVMNTYLLNAPEAIEKGLKHAVENGVDVAFYTNSKSAHANFFPGGLPHFSSVRGLKRILGSNPISTHLHLYLTSKTSRHPPYPLDRNDIYTHYKIAVADDWVILGSHNFTLASATRNDEVQFFFKSEKFSNFLPKFLMDSENVYSEVSIEAYLSDLNRVPFIFWPFRDFIDATF
jgi:phosphatidylserine/phosphatidylglycerophosphate/cardiolipin synthase-like enzyme